MIWRFREFELDEVRFELRRAGARVAIAPKPLALLVYLAMREPGAVPRAELLRDLWPGLRVTDASLSRAVRAARAALGEAGDAECGTIRTVRGRGYAFSGSLAGRDVARCARIRVAPFVGRIRDLAKLEQALDLLGVGRGCVLRIGGEPGIGKSRLLDELATRARARGVAAVIGSCRKEAEGPLWPWPEIASRLAEECRETSLEELLFVANGAGSPREARTTATAHAGFGDPHRVATCLRRAAAARPLVLLVDDLQWIGAGAAELLCFAARALRGAPVTIAVSYRTAGARPTPAATTTLGDLARLSHTLPEIVLDGFSPAEIETYVEATTGRPPARRVGQALLEATGGRPFFLRELAASLDARSSADPRDVGPVPPSIDAFVEDELGRLSTQARTLLEVASLIGPAGDIRVLARASGRREESVLPLLEEARRELLIEIPNPGRFRFRHGVVRAALRAGIGTRRRVAIERRLAAWADGSVAA